MRYAGWLRYSFARPTQPLAAQHHIRIAAFDAPTPLIPYMLLLGQGSGRGCPAAAVCKAENSQLAVEETIRSPGSSCILRHGLHTPDKMTSLSRPPRPRSVPIMISNCPRETTAIAVAMPQGNQPLESVDESLSLGAILGRTQVRVTLASK